MGLWARGQGRGLGDAGAGRGQMEDHRNRVRLGFPVDEQRRFGVSKAVSEKGGRRWDYQQWGIGDTVFFCLIEKDAVGLCDIR